MTRLLPHLAVLLQIREGIFGRDLGDFDALLGAISWSVNACRYCGPDNDKRLRAMKEFQRGLQMGDTPRKRR
jgi:hypothetical protein